MGQNAHISGFAKVVVERHISGFEVHQISSSRLAIENL